MLLKWPKEIKEPHIGHCACNGLSNILSLPKIFLKDLRFSKSCASSVFKNRDLRFLGCNFPTCIVLMTCFPLHSFFPQSLLEEAFETKTLMILSLILEPNVCTYSMSHFFSSIAAKTSSAVLFYLSADDRLLTSIVMLVLELIHLCYMGEHHSLQLQRMFDEQLLAKYFVINCLIPVYICLPKSGRHADGFAHTVESRYNEL